MASPIQLWTKEDVVREIRRFYSHGESLSGSVWKKDPIWAPIFYAAFHRFGSWRAALGAAGVPPEEIDAVCHRSAKLSWSMECLLTLVRDRARDPRPFVESGPGKDLGDRRIGNMARGLLGPKGREKALALCGLPPTAIRTSRGHYLKGQEAKKQIVEEVHRLRESGADLSTTAMVESNFKLYRRGCYHFKNWRNALVAAGLDPSKIARKRDWTAWVASVPENEFKDFTAALERPAERRP